MYDYQAEIEDKALKSVGLELMFMTPEKCNSDKGINPKYWKFDNYNFQRMDEDDDVYRLLCNFDDVDFDRFFQY